MQIAAAVVDRIADRSLCGGDRIQTGKGSIFDIVVILNSTIMHEGFQVVRDHSGNHIIFSRQILKKNKIQNKKILKKLKNYLK